MKNWKFLFAVLLAVIIFPYSAHAALIISEIMYDADGSDSKREWIEVFNAGSALVTFTKDWRINDGSNHVLNEPPKNGGRGVFTIAPGAYVVFADNAETFISEHPGGSYTVIDTVLELKNDAGTITIFDADKNEVAKVSYTKDRGAAGDGLSLHRQSISSPLLTSGTPSPGTGLFTQEDGVNSGATEKESESSAAVEAAKVGEALTGEPKVEEAQSSATSEVPQVPASSPSPPAKGVIGMAVDVQKEDADEGGDMPLGKTKEQTAAAVIWGKSGIEAKWWGALATLIVFSAVAAVIARRQARDSWQIEKVE